MGKLNSCQHGSTGCRLHDAQHIQSEIHDNLKTLNNHLLSIHREQITSIKHDKKTTSSKQFILIEVHYVSLNIVDWMVTYSPRDSTIEF